jgi:hypothetical protein
VFGGTPFVARQRRLQFMARGVGWRLAESAQQKRLHILGGTRCWIDWKLEWDIVMRGANGLWHSSL